MSHVAAGHDLMCRHFQARGQWREPHTECLRGPKFLYRQPQNPSHNSKGSMLARVHKDVHSWRTPDLTLTSPKSPKPQNRQTPKVLNPEPSLAAFCLQQDAVSKCSFPFHQTPGLSKDVFKYCRMHTRLDVFDRKGSFRGWPDSSSVKGRLQDVIKAKHARLQQRV